MLQSGLRISTGKEKIRRKRRQVTNVEGKHILNIEIVTRRREAVVEEG